MPSVLAGAAVAEHSARGAGQPKDVVEFPIRKQTGIGRDRGSVELELHTAVEIDPKRLPFRFTHRVRHDSTAQTITTH